MNTVTVYIVEIISLTLECPNFNEIKPKNIICKECDGNFTNKEPER
jgi:hypothetical protein